MLKMYTFSIVILTFLALIDVEAAPSKYTTKFDNINTDDILNNDRLLNNYFKCLMDQGKCTPEGEELKKWIPDAIDNDCKDCSEKQRKEAEKVIKFLHDKKDTMWKQLEEKYDPTGKYREKYQKDAERLEIKV
ncbi:ejaculatory bulb-specific protein 3-like [Daktulosphaira vitifoliae]|uniref:Chemosensory protein 6 n=1 Tax=Daktulosphaira vitifoliae TaxID=58002 RepID=A0A1W6R6E7_DAKVI|nr:ejaculatory bulb-specific protein 3-like [Daktulosphaira vitifoliae]ARO50010.1 chemosensory protein 6 [Daktulosphaira vitifoliae]